jgi:hypothetical protein
MGQKVNPIIFRQPYGKPQSSVWLSKFDNYSQFLSQKTEIENFLTFLSKSGGIIPKSFFMKRTSEFLELHLDLYFSSFLAKQRQVLGATSFFKILKKKYTFLPRIKYMSSLMEPFESSDNNGIIKAKPLFTLKKFPKGGVSTKYRKSFSFSSIEKRNFLKGEKLKYLPETSLSLSHQSSSLKDCKISVNSLKKKSDVQKKYKKSKDEFYNGCKTRALPSHVRIVKKVKRHKKDSHLSFKNLSEPSKNVFFLIFNEKKKSLLKEESTFSILSVKRKSFFPRIVRIMLPKFMRFFRIKKTFYRFRKFNRIKSCGFLKRPTNLSLLNLNESLCNSLQNFTGIEKVKIKFYSSQLKFLPLLKVYLKKVRRGLISFRRNKNFASYFKESLQILFLVFSTFSQGNAALLSRLITRLLQANRRQIFIIKFLKKALAVFFKRLPSRCVSLSGIRVMLKGRLNKRPRTKTIIIQQGQISSQTLSMPVDFHYTQVVTRFGSFGLRIWLSKKLI